MNKHKERTTIFPENLKKYNNLRKISESFSLVLRDEVDCKIEQLKIYQNIEKQTDSILDELAWHWNVDFYSPELEKTKKIELIKNSYYHHSRKGTSGVLESALKTVIEAMEVKEWYTYEGNPYMFKLIVSGEMITEEKIKKVYELVNNYKNMRSTLEGFEIIKISSSSSRIFSVNHSAKRIINEFKER